MGVDVALRKASRNGLSRPTPGLYFTSGAMKRFGHRSLDLSLIALHQPGITSITDRGDSGRTSRDVTKHLPSKCRQGQARLPQRNATSGTLKRPLEPGVLVPYRALASELRSTLIKRLNDLGIAARCAYGGTVPTGTGQGIENLRVVATPRHFRLAQRRSNFFQHLASRATRVTSLTVVIGELVLSYSSRECAHDQWMRFCAAHRLRFGHRPKYRRDQRLAGWSCRPLCGANTGLLLLSSLFFDRGRTSLVGRFECLPRGTPTLRDRSFLRRDDFRFIRPDTDANTRRFDSVKTQREITAARKNLPMGTIAVFAATKQGNQGAIGLAEELIKQVGQALPLPAPRNFITVGPGAFSRVPRS